MLAQALGLYKSLIAVVINGSLLAKAGPGRVPLKGVPRISHEHIDLVVLANTSKSTRKSLLPKVRTLRHFPLVNDHIAIAGMTSPSFK